MTIFRSIALAIGLIMAFSIGSQARHPERVILSAATPAGYAILAEADVTEKAKGVLHTRAIFWRLRAVYKTSNGQRVFAHPRIPPTWVAGTRDTEVVVDRAWKRRDVGGESKRFQSMQEAIRKFRALRMTGDISRMPRGRLIVSPLPPKPIRPGPARPMHHHHPATATAPPPRPHVGPMFPGPGLSEPPLPSCKETLIDKGHAAMHLSKCKGVPRKCAVTLLENGHSPIHLGQCHKRQNQGCVLALLRNGHRPIHLNQCAGIRNTTCAVKLLKRGDSPIHLGRCK